MLRIHKSIITKVNLLIAILGVAASSNAQNIATIAGNGTEGYSGDDGPATSAEIYIPRGIAFDAAGNIYFSDDGNNVIREITLSTGDITTIAGNGTEGYSGNGVAATSAEFNDPYTVVLDAAGNVYVADGSNNIVREVTVSTGIITTIAGIEGSSGNTGDNGAATSAKLNRPVGLAFDAVGNLYIADLNASVVRKVTISTGIITTVAGTGTAGYNGDAIAATTAKLNAPYQITFDAAGNLYIADSGNNRVRKVSASTGFISTIAGTGTAGNTGNGSAATSAKLNSPQGVALDLDTNVYIADFNNNVVREITIATGIITVIAGTGTAGYNGDGVSPTSAELQNPDFLIFDASENLYIGDQFNNRIREVAGLLNTGLPINLLSFIGKNQGSNNLLKWETASEINNNYFEIERSGDAKNFQPIDTVKGAGNSTQTLSYSFVDEHTLNRTNYYRLKQTDYDGKSTFSSVIPIAAERSGNLSVNLYPNPSSGNFTILSNKNLKAAQIQIFDIYGQIIYEEDNSDISGKQIHLNVPSSGIYLVKISDELNSSMRKLVIQ